MSDGINRTSGIRPPTELGRSSGIDRNKRPEEHDPQKVDAHAHQKQTEESFDESLTLTVATARLIVKGDIPKEVREALESFAPLGDLKGAEILCDILDNRGVVQIPWPQNLSMRQALEVAAS